MRAILVAHATRESAELHAEVNKLGPPSIVLHVDRVILDHDRWYAVMPLEDGASWGVAPQGIEIGPTLVYDYVAALAQALRAVHEGGVGRPGAPDGEPR